MSYATACPHPHACRYLLSCARKIGCVIFLGWEDVLSARPRLLLLLLASFMAHDRKREAAAGFIQ